MRKLFIVSLSICCIVLFGFTLSSIIQIFHYDLSAPAELTGGQDSAYRLVLITQEMDTPFWDSVEKGATLAAKQRGVELAVWGQLRYESGRFSKKDGNRDSLESGRDYRARLGIG